MMVFFVSFFLSISLFSSIIAFLYILYVEPSMTGFKKRQFGVCRCLNLSWTDQLCKSCSYKKKRVLQWKASAQTHHRNDQFNNQMMWSNQKASIMFCETQSFAKVWRVRLKKVMSGLKINKLQICFWFYIFSLLLSNLDYNWIVFRYFITNSMLCSFFALFKYTF